MRLKAVANMPHSIYLSNIYYIILLQCMGLLGANSAPWNQELIFGKDSTNFINIKYRVV